MIDRVARNPLLLGVAFLAAALLGAALFALIQSAGAGGERARTEAVVRAYLLDHGEIIPEAMDRLQQRQAEAALAPYAGEIVKPFASAWEGNPKGDVTIVTFMDYNCGYCRANLADLAKLVAADPKVRVVYREYPVLAKSSITAASWALAAAEQGKFKPFHDALFAAGQVDDASIAAAAARAGLDVAAAKQRLEAPGIKAEIDRNYQYGRDLHIEGTPGWVIGKHVYHVAQSYDQLAQAVADARAGK